MNCQELLLQIEKKIPLHLAFSEDPVGYIGSMNPCDLEISRVLVLMDYYPHVVPEDLDVTSFDLIILHHPPMVKPEIPAYVIHSNWDRVYGGACDALAECLQIQCTGVLDTSTGLGRIGVIPKGPIPLGRFIRYVMRSLKISSIRVVNFFEERPIFRVGLVSGFGLNQHLITIAQNRDIDLFLSGDLTHPGAICAKKSDLVLVDGTHYATELPGLIRLGELVSGIGNGLSVQVLDTGVPIELFSDYYRPVSYKRITYC